MGRLGGIRGRQIVLLVLVPCASVAVIIATALGWSGVAASLEALTVAVLLVAVGVLLARVGVMHQSTLATAHDTRDVVQQMQRRLVAAVEKERLAASDRHQALETALQRNQELLEFRFDETQRAKVDQVEALLQLLAEIQRRRPRLVLDLGGGRSAVWLAYAVEKVGGRLVTLHHDPATVRETREALTAHGVVSIAEVREAPLRQTTAGGRKFRWYDTAAVADLAEIDLLLVGGPPTTTGPDARLPAIPVLVDRLAAAATVILCGGDPERDADASRRWSEIVPQLSADGEAVGGSAVLTYVRRESSLAGMPE